MVLGSQTALASSVQFINESFRGSGLFVCFLVKWFKFIARTEEFAHFDCYYFSEDSSMLPKIIIVTGIP